MKLKDFKDFIAKSKWIFAKTYAEKAPHEYTLRKDHSKKEFEDAVVFIRENGQTELFWRKEFIYYYEGEYKYWTYGDPVSETILINRAKA